MILSKMPVRAMPALMCAGIGMGMLALPSLAQEKVEAVYITGTRITTPGSIANSPISSVGAEEIKSSQPIAAEEFFKNLPAAVPAIGPTVNNGSGATVDLRGLGPNRTLVLLNGRRLVPFNLNGSADTNAIPVALISRLDVVTGGASVVYGADAVAGVANFLLKRNFSGVELSTSYGATTEQRDTRRKRSDLVLGANLADGRGNVMLSVGKTNADPLTQGERSDSITSVSSTTGLPTGSITTIPAAFTIGKGTGGSDALAGTVQIDPATGRLNSGAVLYNTNPLNYFQTALERTQATSMGNFKINEHAEVYAELLYSSSKVSSKAAETGTFANSFNVPIGNPFIPALARQQICERRAIPAASCVEGNPTMVPMVINRRFVEMGPRHNDFANKLLQYTVGLKGHLAYDWTYDGYWSRGNADQVQNRTNSGSYSKAGQALNALNTSTCVLNTNGCVPLNVFGAPGSITPAMLAYVNLNAMLLQSVQQDVAMATLSGDLGPRIVSPFAAAPVTLAFSVEQRKLGGATQSDAASQIQAEVLGSLAPVPDRSGSFRLREYALEALLPVVRDKPLMHAVSLELGYRQTGFATGGKSQNYGSWKYGGEWEPVKSLRLRAMMQKATRAPNVNELFAPVVTTLSNLALDPCQKAFISKDLANTAGTLSNLCRLTGVPLDLVGNLQPPSSNQINNETGGNPNLGPEQARTRTVGFVWEPLPKLAISLDYYKIGIDRAVSSMTTTDVLDGCYSAKFNPAFAFNALCALIGRNTLDGTFNGNLSRGVQTGLTNLGTQSTSGVDLNIGYKVAATTLGLGPAMGAFDLSLALTEVRSFHFQPTPVSLDRDCLGYYSNACGGPTYKRKFTQRTNWTVGRFVLGYAWRHVSAVAVEPPATGVNPFLAAYSKIEAYNYVDLHAVWNVTSAVRLNVSLNNAANKQAPFVGNSIASTIINGGNTFPSYYDAVGRYLTFGASVKF